MKKIILALPLVLAACATSGPGGINTSNPLVQGIISATTTYCKFEPSVESVVGILNAGFGGNPVVVGASAVIDTISKALCGAMSAHAGMPHSAQVAGVRIRGHFIK